MLAMQSGELQWGDFLCDSPCIAAPVAPRIAAPAAPRPVTPPVVAPVAAPRIADLPFETIVECVAANSTEWLAHCEREVALLWEQPFARDLSVLWDDHYYTKRMTETDYDAFMTWISARGWSIPFRPDPTQESIVAVPDYLPPAKWLTRAEWEAKEAKRNAGRAPIAQFCRESAAGIKCRRPGCPYVHEDTMVRVNYPCRYGQRCRQIGTCIHMHPGEKWKPGMVIRRS